MEEKHCRECVYYSSETPSGYISAFCGYPIPEWVRIRAGGGFISGHEASTCQLYKSRLELSREGSLKAP